MELKINYQYTYFVHPFIIKDGKYHKYLLKMLKDKDFKLKVFQKEKDYTMYKYFLPNTKELLFSSFSFGSSELKRLEELPIETRAAILSKYSCNIFEYTLKKDIQGKVDDRKGIFFTIQKVEVICFSTGICFLVIKTNIDEDSKRYYPYSTLASQVIGACGTDNQGLSGIEYSYDSILKGTSSP